MATLDANIILGGKPAQFESPVNALAKMLQVQEAQQGNQMRTMQMQQAQSAVERSNRLSSLLGQKYAKPEDMEGALLQGGFMDEAGKLSKNRLDATKTQADIGKTTADTEKLKIATAKDKVELIGQLLNGVTDQQTYDQARSVAQQNGLDVSTLPPQYNPQQIEQAKQQTMSVQQQLEQVWKAKGYDLDVRKQGEVERNNKVQNNISQGNLNVARGNLGLSRERLDFDKAKPVATGGKTGPMSVTMQKELLESDDISQSSKAVLKTLEAAKAKNKDAYSGYFAKGRAVLASNLPGNTPGADATIDLDNMMTGQALESLKLVFGGMPTEGERKILLDMQASADKTPTQREAIMNRAIAAAKVRGDFADSKAKAIRNGTYLTEGVPQPGAASPDLDALLNKYK